VRAEADAGVGPGQALLYGYLNASPS
jgi:hypothetical protein